MSKVTDESTLEWLAGIEGIAKSDEATVILRLVPEVGIKPDDIDERQAQRDKRKKELAENINRLELFESLSKGVKSALRAELENLEEKN